MFINFWYVAEESRNVRDQPVHVRMLGQEFALFRDSAGTLHALNNVCVHRGGSLAHGKVRGDCIECPYHGWQYDGAGVCRKIPSLGPEGRVPGRAKLDAYPVIEKYDLVFVFLGDLPEEQRPPIMDIPDWGDPAWRPNFMRFEFNFDYKRSIENGVDTAHNEFTHSIQVFKKEGKPIAIPDLDLEVSADGWEHGYHIVLPGAVTGQRGQAGKTAPAPTTVYTGFHGVSSLRTLIHPTAHIKLHQYIFETPIDESHTRIFFYNFRSYLLGPEHDENSIRENTTVAYEDRDVLERLTPVLSPRLATRELLVPSDKPMLRYRERLKTFEEQGWRIDVDRVNAARGKEAFAIPGPARRLAGGWVLEPVPLVAKS